MTIVSSIVGALGGNILNGTNEILKTVIGSEADREANLSAEQRAAQTSYAAEWSARASRTWFDVFVDGINRLVRPSCTFGTIGLFGWSVADPVEFSETMRALALMPEALWIMLGGILAFWFGGRMVADNNAIVAAAKTGGAIAEANVQLAKHIAKSAEKPSEGNAALEEWKRSAAYPK